MSINKLILGDNLEILKSMEADSVDLVFVRLLSDSLFLLIIAYYVMEGAIPGGFGSCTGKKGII